MTTTVTDATIAAAAPCWLTRRADFVVALSNGRVLPAGKLARCG